RSAVESHYAGLRKLPALKRHRIKRQADGRLATINAIRAAVAILIGAFVWEVTAWSYGGAYMSLLSVVCARFAIMNNMILISKYFFYGAVCSVLASIIPVFLVMPITSDYAVFAIPVAVLMFLGGLALRIPALAGVAASYVNFFPWVLTLDNQARVDEVTWFNQSLALLLALWSGVQVFRTVLPFSVTQAWAQLRRQLVKEIQKLKEPLRGRAQTQRLWTNETTLRMEQIIRFAGQIPQDEVDSMIRGTLAVMTVGRNLLTLRDLVALGRLPPSALAAGEHMVRDIIHLTEQGQESSPMTVEEFTQEQAHLETVFHGSRGLSRRRDLAAGIGCLRIIRFEYQTSRTFFLRGYGAAAGQVLGAG
ncbi:FUSC family protein, partial [Bombella apis]